MTTTLADLEDVDDALEGAVIESMEGGVEGLHIFLRDGRILVFPDARICAIYQTPRSMH